MDSFNPVPKPNYKKKGRAKRNPLPTAEDYCRYCKTPYASTHEVYEGTGRRQISIRYKMQVKLCMKCHEDIQTHPLQGRDLELKQEFQRKFEAEGNSRELFRKLFSVSYL
jgi:hypothetical protein